MRKEIELDPSPEEQNDKMEMDLTSTDAMTEDIVENFARQLDEVVRIQDTESDAEDDTIEDEHFGYQQLPQDDDDEDEYQQLQSDDEEEVEVKDKLEFDVDPSARLNQETSDLIKSIMTNIQLPKGAVPEWAKKIPEEAWLPHVKK